MSTNMVWVGLAIIYIVLIIVIAYVCRSTKVNFGTRHIMDYTSTSPDWIDWDDYYSFDSNYFLQVNKENRIVGDAMNIADGAFILTVIPAASSLNVGDWIKLKCETFANVDTKDISTYIFEDSPEATQFNQVYAYHKINNDSPTIYLEVINDGGKRWVMFGGYSDW